MSVATSANPNPLYASSGSSLAYGGRIGVMHTYDAETQLLRGTMSFSKSKLQELDPSYTGYTHVFVIRIPPVLTEPARGNQISGFDDDVGYNADASKNSKNALSGADKAKAHCRNLKALFEMGCTSYSGTPDLTLNTSEVNIGWSERSYPAPTFSAYDGKQFTLKCLETRGEPLRRGIEYYISAIADPNVKAAMMNGALVGDSLMEPTLANFTWSFMIVQTDQTLLNIQDITLWNSCIITGIERSSLDWENGTIDIVQPRDVNIVGVYMPDSRNPIIEKKARELMATRLKYYKRYQDMDSTDLGEADWKTID